MATITYDLNADTIKKNANVIQTEFSNIDKLSKELETKVKSLYNTKPKVWWSKRANSYYRLMKQYVTNNYKYLEAASDTMDDLVQLANKLDSSE